MRITLAWHDFTAAHVTAFEFKLEVQHPQHKDLMLGCLTGSVRADESCEEPCWVVVVSTGGNFISLAHACLRRLQGCRCQHPVHYYEGDPLSEPTSISMESVQIYTSLTEV